jgi:lipopolysaccharide transport system permease protein
MRVAAEIESFVKSPELIVEVRIDSKGHTTERPLADFWEARGLTFLLAQRDVRLRYRHSFVGIGWAVAQPLLTVATLVIFRAFMGVPESGGIPYPLLTLSGLVAWTFLVHTLTQCSTSVLRSAAIATKVYFPRLVLPVSAALAAAADFLISVPLIPAMMVYYRIAPGTPILFLPLFLLQLLLLAGSLGIWLSILNVRFRDVTNALPFLTQLWFFLTPIAYPATAIPAKWRFAAGLNPMFGILEGFRWSLFGGEPPTAASIGTSVVITIALLVGGVFFFSTQEADLAELI